MSGHEVITRFFRRLCYPKRNEMESFVNWARESAVMLDPVDWPNTSVEELSFLDRALEGKRIVYLGEEDHWIHEKNQYRFVMLRYLLSRGWRYIGEELGWSDGIRANNYLITGDPTHLDRMATYGYKGALRTDRDDKPTGILRDSGEKYPTEAFAHEQYHLLEELRRLSCAAQEVNPFTYFGFDIDALPGCGYEDLTALLEPWRSVPEADDLLTLLSRNPGETIAEEIARIDAAIRFMEDHSTTFLLVLGPGRYGDMQRWTLTLRESLDFVRIANPARDWKTLNIAMALREQAMCRHVLAMLEQMGPDDKLVLMGHNRHLSKNIRAIKNPGGAPPGGNRVPSLGTHLANLLPGQVFSIWMLHEQGMSSQPFGQLSNQYVSIPGSLNYLLARVGDACLLLTASGEPASGLLKRNLNIMGIYNAVYQTDITKQADAVFFIRKVSPLQIGPTGLPPMGGGNTLQ